MKMKSVLGIDLGTSSVKILQRYTDGSLVKAKAGYQEISPAGWWNAVKDALAQSDLETVEAIGLSSQVGTYVVDGKEVIGWDSGIGAKELDWIRKEFKLREFVQEISMPHPDILSYPLPRLKYINEKYSAVEKVCQPKDFICERLTGNCVTDPYSWRGLVNLETKKYSDKLLNAIVFSKEKLPEVIRETDLAGYTGKIELGEKVLPEGIPVYTGLNDYFSALLGMGIQNVGDMFDISGTSEHLGVIEENLNVHTKMVSGPYLKHYVHYGVTASSGASLDFGLRLYKNGMVNLDEMHRKQPPIFLPYLNGERAPIWDADARGMFFGISAGCTEEELAYSVLEGVVFSLYHIYESMGMPRAVRMKIAGGAAVNSVLNQLKAELFGFPVDVQQETDSSALGAAMIASVGAGWFTDYDDVVEQVCSTKMRIEPTGKYNEWLKSRFCIYKELYPAVKAQYEELRRMRK